jgi:hypothetical protein
MDYFDWVSKFIAAIRRTDATIRELLPYIIAANEAKAERARAQAEREIDGDGE